MMKKLVFLIFFSCTTFFSAQAEEYKNFRLKGPLVEREFYLSENQHQPTEPTQIIINQSDNELINAWSRDIGHDVLRHIQYQTNDTSEVEPLFKKIIGPYLLKVFKQIALDQSLSIIDTNKKFDLGLQNERGLQWQKPMGSFAIKVNRGVRQSLFSNDWIVHDQFILSIDAQTFLKSLKDADMIEISAKTLNAYAGIKYERTYDFYHQAPSFIAGFTQSFDKLFLPFLNFSYDGLANLKSEEVITQNDLLSVQMSGEVNYPFLYIFNVKGKLSAEYQSAKKIAIKRTSFPAPMINITKEKTKSGKLAVEAALEVDFIKILNLTLFSYELGWEMSHTSKTHLAFNPTQLAQINNSDLKRESLNDFLKDQKLDISNLNEYVKAHELNEKSYITQKYGSIIWGGAYYHAKESIEIKNDVEQRNFKRHDIRKITYKENFWSKLFGWILSSIFGKQEATKDISSEYNITLEIDEDRLAIDTPPTIDIVSTKYINKKYKNLNNKTKNEFSKWMQEDSLASYQIPFLIMTEKILPPFMIKNKIRLNTDALQGLFELSHDESFVKSAKVCGSQNPAGWADPRYRYRQKLYGTYSLYRCVSKTYSDWVKVFEYYQFYGTYPYDKVINLVKEVYEVSETFKSLTDYFSQKNISIEGVFSGNQIGNIPFVHSYSNGEKGNLSLIEQYRQDNSTGVNLPTF